MPVGRSDREESKLLSDAPAAVEVEVQDGPDPFARWFLKKRLKAAVCAAHVLCTSGRSKDSAFGPMLYFCSAVPVLSSCPCLTSHLAAKRI